LLHAGYAHQRAKGGGHFVLVGGHLLELVGRQAQADAEHPAHVVERLFGDQACREGDADAADRERQPLELPPGYGRQCEAAPTEGDGFSGHGDQNRLM